MTSLAATPAAVNHLLDEDWIVAIQEELDARPETLADVVEPELLGRFDGEMGKPCDPTRYYARLGHIEAYIIGWKNAQAVLTPRATTFMYEGGRLAYTNGDYTPPSCTTRDYDEYIRGYNDAWAAETGRTSWTIAR